MAEALGWSELVNDQYESGYPDHEKVMEYGTLMQAHATLALVEQQRIANLIALSSLPKLDGFENEVYDARLEVLMSGVLDRREVPAVPGYGPAGIDEQTFIRPEIAAALGIDQIGETR